MLKSNLVRMPHTCTIVAPRSVSLIWCHRSIWPALRCLRNDRPNSTGTFCPAAASDDCILYQNCRFHGIRWIRESVLCWCIFHDFPSPVRRAQWFRCHPTISADKFLLSEYTKLKITISLIALMLQDSTHFYLPLRGGNVGSSLQSISVPPGIHSNRGKLAARRWPPIVFPAADTWTSYSCLHWTIRCLALAPLLRRHTRFAHIRRSIHRSQYSMRSPDRSRWLDTIVAHRWPRASRPRRTHTFCSDTDLWSPKFRRHFSISFRHRSPRCTHFSAVDTRIHRSMRLWADLICGPLRRNRVRIEAASPGTWICRKRFSMPGNNRSFLERFSRLVANHAPHSGHIGRWVCIRIHISCN